MVRRCRRPIGREGYYVCASHERRRFTAGPTKRAPAATGQGGVDPGRRVGRKPFRHRHSGRVHAVAYPLPHRKLPYRAALPLRSASAGGLGLSFDPFGVYAGAMDVIFAAVCTAVALLIFSRRSGDRMGLLVSLALLTFGTATSVFTMEAHAARHPALEVPTSFLHFLGAASFGLFLYLPDGRFVPRWPRWVVLVWIAWQVPKYFFPDWYLNPGPHTLHAPIDTVVWMDALSTAIYSQGY
jgi:hypothetical protein